MSLGLDLSASHAKMQRAVEQLVTLDGEVRDSFHKSDPYAFVFDVNPKTGWVKVIAQQQPRELGPSVVLGEFVHNLRSALDYIVTALVAASPPTILTTRHQFPIYLTGPKFRRAVGSSRQPRGSLVGVRHGFTLIEKFQPYHTGPGAPKGAIGLLQRLSNSDKHRALLLNTPFPRQHTLAVIAIGGGKAAEEREPSRPLRWQPNGQAVLKRIRFRRPLPTEFHAKAVMEFEINFLDAAFLPDYPKPILFTIQDLRTMGEQVEVIISAFDAL